MDSHAAAELATEAAEALSDAVTVTTDFTVASNTVTAGGTAVLIDPPQIEFPTTSAAETTWTVWIASGRADHTEAWQDTADTLAALVKALGIDDARPGTFKPNHGPGVTAWAATLTRSYDLI